MAISIYFESYFRQQPYENTFKPENYQEWIVKEKWSVTPIVIQEITVENEDEYFESYYYVDLEIVSVLQENDAQIIKSERMASNNIKFIIKGKEFSCFQTYCGIVDVNKENYAGDHMYRYKITLTPIFQLCDESFKKPGKRTKIDLLSGLKTLSNDIFSMKGKLFSDITICCGNKRVKSHKNILSARSIVFKKFLHGIEDEEVQSCLEIEPVIDEIDANSIEVSLDGSGDTSINSDGDAAAIHPEEDNRVQIILNIESEMEADEATNGDKDSTSIDAEKYKEVQSCLETEPVIDRKDINSLNSNLDGGGDNPTNNGSDTAAIHTEVNNRIPIILSIESEQNTDEATSDIGTTTIYAKKDELLNCLEIKPKSIDDTTEDDKDCTTISAEKNNKSQITLESKLKIGDPATDDDSTNDGNVTTVIYLKKYDKVQHYSRIESEINDDYFEDDNCTNNNDDSANANGTLAMCTEKDNEIQNKISSKQSFEKESEVAFNVGACTSAMPVQESEEIQYGIELESDDDNDILYMPADEGNEIQNILEIQEEYVSNNNEVLPPITEENEVQTESESGNSDDISTLSDNNTLKVRLKRVHPSIFREFIDFIYSGQYKTTDIKKAKALLIAARDYGICDLEYKCIMHLRSQISIETCDDIYSFASACKCDDLQICVLDDLKHKIVGRKRRNIPLIQMIEQGNDDIEDEEGLTTFEKIRWLNVMRNHPIYFKDILKLKKGRKIRTVFSKFFPETSFDDDDIMADCRERLGCILNACVTYLDEVEG